MADFFEEGKTYYDKDSDVVGGKHSTFEVVAVYVHSTQGTRHAIGWWHSVNYPDIVLTAIDEDEWLDFEEDWEEVK